MAAAPTATSTLSLHDALPISPPSWLPVIVPPVGRDSRAPLSDSATAPANSASPALHVAARGQRRVEDATPADLDRKSTRLNSSHSSISYAVFCLKKKNNRPPK